MQTTRLQIGRRAFLATGLAVAAAPTGSALSETPPVEDDAHRYRPVLHYTPHTGLMNGRSGRRPTLVLLDALDAAAAMAELAQPLQGMKGGRMSFTRHRPTLHPP